MHNHKCEVMMMRVAIFLIAFLFKCGSGTLYQCNSKSLCGCANVSATVAKIVGGENARRGTWPWAVFLRYNNIAFCGGTVISSSSILTAAHCIDTIINPSRLTIVAGSLTLTPSSNDAYQTRSVKAIYKHSGYNARTKTNDLAILLLSSPLDMSRQNIKPICLPSGSIPQPPDNIDMVAIGWGTTSSGSNRMSENLLQVTLKSIPKASTDCKNVIGDNTRQFCAGISTGGKGNRR